jgi:hypothetical protein
MIGRTGCPARLHGTYFAYRNGCRCVDAETEYTKARERHRARRGLESPYVSPIGARRRVQALIAIGHTYMTIAAASGLGKQAVYKIAAGVNDKLMPETVAKILAGFEALSTTPGACRRNVKLSRLRGWAPAGMWDAIDDPDEEVDCSEDPDLVDEVLVERFLKGHASASQLNDAEKREAEIRLSQTRRAAA